jgi:hypothetical protein
LHFEGVGRVQKGNNVPNLQIMIMCGYLLCKISPWQS